MKKTGFFIMRVFAIYIGCLVIPGEAKDEPSLYPSKNW